MAAITPIKYHENNSPVTLLLQSCLVDVHACGLMQDVKVWVKHMMQARKNAVRFTWKPKRASLNTHALKSHGKMYFLDCLSENEDESIHVKSFMFAYQSWDVVSRFLIVLVSLNWWLSLATESKRKRFAVLLASGLQLGRHLMTYINQKRGANYTM